MSGSSFVGKVHYLEKFLRSWSHLLNDPLDLNIVVFVLHDIKRIFVVKKVKASACIDLKEADISFITSI